MKVWHGNFNAEIAEDAFGLYVHVKNQTETVARIPLAAIRNGSRVPSLLPAGAFAALAEVLALYQEALSPKSVC